MNCHTCPALAGFIDPVPASEKYRPACAGHKGPMARPADAVDLAAAELLGTLEPATEGAPQ